MTPKKFCQSCCMPLDNDEMAGTEKDGSKSTEYCKYCYANGAFTTADLTLEQMKAIDREQMALRHIPQNVIDMTISMLPGLKRWKK